MTDFDLVWQAYPRKTAKVVGRKAWNRLSPDTATVQAMLDALAWQTQTDQWKRGIIPHFSTWINQQRWTDERPAHVQQVQRESARSAGAEYTRWLQAQRDAREVRH